MEGNWGIRRADVVLEKELSTTTWSAHRDCCGLWEPRSLPQRHTSSRKATPPAPSQTFTNWELNIQAYVHGDIIQTATYVLKCVSKQFGHYQEYLYWEFYSNILLFRLRIKNDRILAYKLHW